MGDRFPIVVPICPYCQEPGLHINSAACLADLREAIALQALTPALAAAVKAVRDASNTPLKYLRRDRRELPPTDVTKTID